MIGIIIPAHNEEELLGSCLRSVLQAAVHPALCGRECVVIVVLDSCTDASRGVAAAFPVDILECQFRSVGAARALGAARAIVRGASWLAFTDADSEVASDWLVAQISLGAEAVCGTIEVRWPPSLDLVRRDFEAHYIDADDHRHIHGANLGIRTDVYLAVSGFSARVCHEDVALVDALRRAGRSIAWSAMPRVRTSPRLDARAPQGFAAIIAETAARLRSKMRPMLCLPPPSTT